MGILEILIIISLVILNGFFVAAEFAMVSVRPSRIDELVRENRSSAIITKKAISKLNDMLSVCQVGITIASLLLGWLGEKFIAQRLDTLVKHLDPSSSPDSTAIHGTAIILSFIVITFLHVSIGELVPKTVAIQNPEVVALQSAIPMFLFYFLFFPIVWVLNHFTSGFIKTFRLKMRNEHYLHSPDELMILIEEQNRQGRIDNSEFQMIQNTFEFAEQDAKKVMTHRLSIVGISSSVELNEVLKIITEHNFSRYPIYDTTLDKIIGIIHVQAFLEWMAKGPQKGEKVTAIMQNPIFIPETLSIEKVLQKLRLAKQHMAIVVDEYGGVSGLLTMEDIIEEIFGQIRDETDDQDEEIPHTREKEEFVIDGETELEDLKNILEGEVLDDMEDVRTIAGFFLEKHEDMPVEGNVIQIKSGELIVEKMHGNKIESIRFKAGAGTK